MLKANLLPPEFVAGRNAVPVADSLRIPTHPHPLTVVRPGQLDSTEQLRALTHVLQEEEISTPQEEKITFVDKSNPHAIHDLMVISGGETVVSSLYGHSDEFIHRTLGHMARFARSAKDQGLSPVVSWSYDPDTSDRASGQGEKRFHAHFVGRTPKEIAQVHAIEQPLGELSRFRQRRIADEFSLLGGYAITDALRDETLEGITLTEPFSTPQSKLCLQFEVDGGWDGFTDRAAEVGGSLKKIDKAYHQLFGHFVSEITDGNYGQWERPQLVEGAAEKAVESGEGIGFSPDTLRLLGHYVANLHPELLSAPHTDRFIRNQDSNWIPYLYPLGGPSYTTCITEVDGVVKGHVRANMFTDLGGAGVALVDGVMTKVKKTGTPMSDTEYQSRKTFQDEVLADVRDA